MNIAVLSRGESLYSTKSLINAGASMGHVMEVLDPTYCNLTIENGKSIVRFNNEIIDDLHAIIPRIGASNTYFGASLVRHFEQQGVFSVASANGILQSRDKWTCTQILSQGGIPTPNTMLGITANMEVLLENISSFPIIIKILEGTHGQGVILSESYQNALSTIESLKTANVPFLIQEYIKESQGADIRVIVVDNVVVGAMKRQSKAGDFRSNLHRGGSSQKITLSHQEELVALKTAKVLGLKVCGVDILQSQKGPLVLEVNSTPGLEGIQTTTGVDIAKKIISLIERNKK
jgi:ribosomal protein S6--L-glutamate ligase